MSGLVTGEAVELGLRPARLPSRALAVFIDLLVAWVAYIVVSLAALAATASLDDAARAAVAVGLFVLVLVGAPIAVETLSNGRSLGKAACGLRVVRDDGGPIRFRHALVRGAVGVIEILGSLGTISCLASLVSARGRRVGDVFAGTLVVRERIPVGQGVTVPPAPPWLAGRFAELDLSRVPDALWLAVRQYLTRMPQLDPEVGWAMAGRLAADVAERTGVPVPEGVPPTAYLAAVVGERQARDVRRVFGAGAGPGTDGWSSPAAGRWAGAVGSRGTDASTWADGWPGADTGRGAGQWARADQWPGTGAGHGIDRWPEAEAGLRAGTGPQAGQWPGADAGSGADTGLWADAGFDADAGAGARRWAGTDAGSGAGAGTGTSPWAGAGGGPGTDPWSGAHTGPGADAGSEGDTGAGANPWPGARTGPQADANPDADAGPEAHQWSGTGEGPSWTHPRRGASTGSGAGPGPAVDRRSGADAGPGAGTGFVPPT